MDNSTLTTLCAIGAIGAVLVLLAALIVLRVLRFGVFGFANIIVKAFTDPRDEEEKPMARAEMVDAPSAEALRARADMVSSDFDAAVERYRQEQAAAGQSAIIEPDPFVPDAPEPTPPQINTRSPIFGRILRDGRFRRMGAGTPGRVRDQDFRRVGRGGEPPEGV